MSRYQHDCANCVPLGQATVRGESVDAYACPQSGWPTIVLRYGGGGPDYHSGNHLVADLPAEMRDRATSLMDGWRSERAS